MSWEMYPLNTRINKLEKARDRDLEKMGRLVQAMLDLTMRIVELERKNN